MPTVEINGTSYDLTDEGFLEDANAWTKDIAQHIADAEDVEMTEKHWDIVEYLRHDQLDNNNEANERGIMKAMSKKWGKKHNSKDMYALFPGMPSKQGRKIAGLPKSTRKGGY